MPTAPFDLDALAAEATPAEPFRFVFDGKTYELPADVDIRALSMMRRGQLAEALEFLLGPVQWKRLSASKKPFGANGMWDGLMDAYGKATQGTSMGESSASADSSPSPEGPSNPTSSGSTASA